MNQNIANRLARAVVKQTELIGWSGLTPEEILQNAVQNRSPLELTGDFVAVFRGTLDDDPARGFELIVTSPLNATAYYWAHHGGGFVHGRTVFDVIRRAPLDWRWNAAAVETLLLWNHTIGTDTLHAEVSRCAPASVYLWADRTLSVETRRWYAEPADGDTGPDTAATAFDAAMDDALRGKQKVLLTLSAGYDSRLLLSALLKRGIKPVVVTMGGPESTDMKIARQISADFGLEHRVVELSPDDYWANADRIVDLTGGSKTFEHWHTYHLAHKAGLPADGVHFAGANGEFVRSYYLDLGWLGRSTALVPLDLPYAYLRYRFSRRRRLPLGWLDGADFGTGAVRYEDPWSRALEFVPEGTRGTLARLDAFYAFGRVRHFIGNGLLLFNSAGPTRSPFLDVRFIQAARGLSRHWKCNSRFHRHLIGRNCPGLLKYATDESGRPMGEQDRPFYWAGRPRTVDYNPVRTMLRSAQVRDLIETSGALDRVASRQLRVAACATNSFAQQTFLLTTHFLLRNVDRGSGSGTH